MNKKLISLPLLLLGYTATAQTVAAKPLAFTGIDTVTACIGIVNHFTTTAGQVSIKSMKQSNELRVKVSGSSITVMATVPGYKTVVFTTPAGDKTVVFRIKTVSDGGLCAE